MRFLIRILKKIIKKNKSEVSINKYQVLIKCNVSW